MSKPRPVRAESTSFKARVLGWAVPMRGRSRGSVTSMVSRRSLASFSTAIKAALRASSMALIISRPALINWPAAGRSSGDNWPMERSRAVNVPFLPSTFCRASSNCLMSFMDDSSCCKDARISSMFSLIPIYLSSIKNRPMHTHGTPVKRGTTQLPQGERPCALHPVSGMGRRALLMVRACGSKANFPRDCGRLSADGTPSLLQSADAGVVLCHCRLQYFRVAQTRKAFVPRAVLCITFF